MKLKPDFTREQFAAFSEPSLKRWAHFENAGGSYMAKQVAHRLAQYDARNRVQPYAAYPASKEAGEMMDASYQIMAQILNVPEDWLYFGASTSANTYTLSRAFASALPNGTNIIVTNQDHEANSGYWRQLANQGIEVREWSVDELGMLHDNDLWPLVDEKTKFVAFPHVSNIVGCINPVAKIANKLRERGVISIVDGVSYAPHDWPDIPALGADIYFFSAYKTYGPHQGIMTIRPEVAQNLPNQGHVFNDGLQRKRFDPAGPQHSSQAAIAGIGEYVSTLYQRHIKGDAGMNEMARHIGKLQRKHEIKLMERFLEGIADLKNLKLIGLRDAQHHVPTLAFYHPDKSGSELARQLRKHQIMASGGHFYAPLLLEAMDIDPEHGVLRLSFVHYTKMKEVEKAIKALRVLDE